MKVLGIVSLVATAAHASWADFYKRADAPLPGCPVTTVEINAYIDEGLDPKHCYTDSAVPPLAHPQRYFLNGSSTPSNTTPWPPVAASKFASNNVVPVPFVGQVETENFLSGEEPEKRPHYWSSTKNLNPAAAIAEELCGLIPRSAINPLRLQRIQPALNEYKYFCFAGDSQEVGEREWVKNISRQDGRELVTAMDTSTAIAGYDARILNVTTFQTGPDSTLAVCHKATLQDNSPMTICHRIREDSKLYLVRATSPTTSKAHFAVFHCNSVSCHGLPPRITTAYMLQ